jgi:phosphate transport system substrate-binding protein
MKRTLMLVVLTCLLLPACNSTAPTARPEKLTVQYTAATVPWLAGVYGCAGGAMVTAVESAADFLDPRSANMVIRLGKPTNLTTFAFQIARDDLLVIVNLKNPSSKMTAEQVNAIFTGQVQNWESINGTDEPVETWVYPAGEDIQIAFGQSILNGSPVPSTAHLANNPDEMLQAVEKNVNAIGIITGRWKTGNVAGVYTAASNLPILAITLSKPEGTLARVIACLQK